MTQVTSDLEVKIQTQQQQRHCSGSFFRKCATIISCRAGYYGHPHPSSQIPSLSVLEFPHPTLCLTCAGTLSLCRAAPSLLAAFGMEPSHKSGSPSLPGHLTWLSENPGSGLSSVPGATEDPEGLGWAHSPNTIISSHSHEVP